METNVPVKNIRHFKNLFLQRFFTFLLDRVCVSFSEPPYSLHHGLGLAGGVVGPEALVLLHLLLHSEHLRLELVAKRRQCVSDVVGELLVQLTLQERCTHTVCHVSRKQNWKSQGNKVSFLFEITLLQI